MSYIKEMLDQGYTPESINDYEKFVYSYIIKFICKIKSYDINILDVGGGTGHLLLPLKWAGYKNLYISDIENTLKTFYESEGINFELHNLELGSMKYKNNFFDIIFCKNVVEHLSNTSIMMREFYRILKPQGKVVIITDDWRKTFRTFWRDPTHVRPYDRESLQRLLRMYEFKIFFKSSFLTKYGIGRLKLYKLFPALAFIGDFIMVVGEKN